MKANNKGGQSLVEVAIVLPVLMVGIFVTAQLAIFCHNRVSLQKMALQIAVKKTAEDAYTPTNILWGRASLSVSHPKILQLPHPWRYFYSLTSVNKSPGHVYSLQASSVLSPSAMLFGKIPTVLQMATAVAYSETPAPGQN